MSIKKVCAAIFVVLCSSGLYALSRADLLFYASLNGTTTAEYAKGSAEPIKGYSPQYDSILSRKGAVVGLDSEPLEILNEPVPYWLDIDIARDYVDKNIGALRWEGTENAIANQGTMSFWMRPIDWTSSGEDRFIAHMKTTKALNFVWAPYYGVVVYHAAQKDNRDTYRQLRRYYSLTPDKEYHFTIAWKPGETFYWIDGQPVRIGMYPGEAVPEQGDTVEFIALGASEGYSSVFGDLLVLNKAVNEAEADSIYRRGAVKGRRSLATIPQINGQRPTEQDKKRMTLLQGWSDTILKVSNNDPSTALLGYDRKNLYISFTYPIPEKFREDRVLYVGQPLETGAKTDNDSAILKDDHFRIVLSPDNGDTLYDFISNAHMARYDTKNGDNSWNGQWEAVSSIIDDEYWHLDFTIPFETIGIPDPRQAEGLMFNLFHKSVRVEDFDSAWAMLGREAVPLASMRLAGEEAVQIEDLGNPAEGTFNISAKIIGIEGAKLTAQMIKHDIETVNLDDMATAPLDSITAEESVQSYFSSEGRADISMSIAEPLAGDMLVSVYAGEESLLHRQRIPFVFSVETTATPAFFPALDRLVIRLDAGSQTMLERGVSAEIRILDSEGSILIGMEDKELKTVIEEESFDTSGIEPGTYPVEVQFSAAGTPLPAVPLQFEKKETPVWMENNIGVSDAVPWPWEDMQVDGKSVSCWGKSFNYGTSLLPDSIYILGENILSEPASIVVSREGSRHVPDDSSFIITGNKPASVEYICESGIEGLKIKTLNRLEFDGFMWVRLKIEPENSHTSVDGLALRIPFKKEYATHWYSGQYPVESLSGYTPETEYFDVPRNFVRIGGYEQGLQFSWQSRQGWKLRNPEKAMRFIPGENDFIVELSLVDHPIEIKEPLTIEFGLHALPSRQYPAEGIRGHWWAWAGHRDLGGVNWHEWPSPGGRKVHIGSHVERQQTGGYWNYLNQPEEYMDAQRNSALINWKRMDDEQQWGAYLNHYITEAHPAVAPETAYHYEDWRAAPASRPDFKMLESSTPKPTSAMVCYGSKSYQDYYVYYFHKYFKKMAGPENIPLATYYDVSSAVSCRNLEHGCGYIDEDGATQPELAILAWREASKRLYNVFKDMRQDNWMTKHMSGLPRMAYCSFYDVLIPGEQWAAYMAQKRAQYLAAGGKEWDGSYYETLPMDRYRAEFSPWIWGPQTAFLTQSYAWVRQGESFNDRHWGAINMVHDAFPYHSRSYVKLFPALREFGWDDRVECLPYWKNSRYISMDIYDQDEFVATMWKRDNRLMILFFNNSDEDRQASVQLHLAELELQNMKNATLTDVETEEALRLDGGTVTMPVKARDFRLMLLK